MKINKFIRICYKPFKLNKKNPLTFVKGYDQTTTRGRIDLCPSLQGRILLHPVATLTGTL